MFEVEPDQQKNPIVENNRC